MKNRCFIFSLILSLFLLSFDGAMCGHLPPESLNINQAFSPLAPLESNKTPTLKYSSSTDYHKITAESTNCGDDFGCSDHCHHHGHCHCKDLPKKSSLSITDSSRLLSSHYKHNYFRSPTNDVFRPPIV